MPTTLDCLELLKQNKVSHQVIGSLYSLCYKISLKTITKKYSTGNHIFINNETTIENIAADAIAPLFSSTGTEKIIGIKRSLDQWEKPITNEANADFFIHKIVWSRVAQHITKLLKETDPVFKKIHSSLKHFVDKNDYNRIHYFGVVYITEFNNKSILGCVVPSGEIESLPGDYFKGGFDTVLESIFRYIENDTGYFPALPMNALVRRLKAINNNDLYNPLAGLVIPHYGESMDIDQNIDISLKQIYGKMNNYYAKSEKIDESILETYRLVLIDVANDFKNGINGRSLYDYLKFRMKDLSRDEFYNEHHSQLNYLINLFKKAIIDKIDIIRLLFIHKKKGTNETIF